VSYGKTAMRTAIEVFPCVRRGSTRQPLTEMDLQRRPILRRNNFYPVENTTFQGQRSRSSVAKIWLFVHIFRTKSTIWWLL